MTICGVRKSVEFSVFFALLIGGVSKEVDFGRAVLPASPGDVLIPPRWVKLWRKR